MKSTPLAVLSLFALLALAGCVMAPYQSAGDNGGHSFKRLGPDTFAVTYQSNLMLVNERLYDFCLLRSAEVAKEFGFDYFVVEGENYGELTRKYSTINITTEPSIGSSSRSGSSSSSSSPSARKSSSAKTMTTVSNPTTEEYAFPNLTMRIRCFTSMPTSPQLGTVLQAEEVRDGLAAKYAIVLY